MDSYSRGPEVDLSRLTIHEVFHRAAERFGDREALVSCHQNLRFTSRELDTEVEPVARGRAGARPRGLSTPSISARRIGTAF